jgi:hypothetical protein
MVKKTALISPPAPKEVFLSKHGRKGKITWLREMMAQK